MDDDEIKQFVKLVNTLLEAAAWADQASSPEGEKKARKKGRAATLQLGRLCGIMDEKALRKALNK